MIFEIAQIEVKPGTEAAFEQGVAKAASLFKGSKGCHGMRLLKSIEQPTHYSLVVTWETLEDHTVHFRNSEAFQQWRALVSDCFAAPPNVGHVTEALIGF
ncbi:antibiotic biosynthesis monooxygenase family protein [Pandoraea terrigena]|uniref:Antibiotic biosynthesis monooxygenase n=1 Tax=Pandoraea terrigena TaxID=2508292 RepID=A0A5E4XVY1_9BURK|nr:antibiotic biosynthesis monooxygenase family protein [Pandoraea terrigena]VVE40490.1 antibiotic biosynthesis monooxygenase [Pandoraea terrigena]